MIWMYLVIIPIQTYNFYVHSYQITILSLTLGLNWFNFTLLKMSDGLRLPWIESFNLIILRPFLSRSGFFTITGTGYGDWAGWLLNLLNREVLLFAGVFSKFKKSSFTSFYKSRFDGDLLFLSDLKVTFNFAWIYGLFYSPIKPFLL